MKWPQPVQLCGRRVNHVTLPILLTLLIHIASEQAYGNKNLVIMIIMYLILFRSHSTVNLSFYYEYLTQKRIIWQPWPCQMCKRMYITQFSLVCERKHTQSGVLESFPRFTLYRQGLVYKKDE